MSKVFRLLLFVFFGLHECEKCGVVFARGGISLIKDDKTFVHECERCSNWDRVKR